MILELWWKAFIIAVILVIIARVFGFSWNLGLVFLLGFVGSMAGLVILIVASNIIREKFSKKKR